MLESASEARVAWLFGLSGAGKSTLARRLAQEWRRAGQRVVVLDGDDLRRGLCRDLGYTVEDRQENIRRAAEVARLFADEGTWVVAAFITPTAALRELARGIVGANRTCFVFVRCPLDICAARDPKGHYAAAMRGERPLFTGVGSVFEEPEDRSCLCVDTSTMDVETCVSAMMDGLKSRLDSGGGPFGPALRE